MLSIFLAMHFLSVVDTYWHDIPTDRHSKSEVTYRVTTLLVIVTNVHTWNNRQGGLKSKLGLRGGAQIFCNCPITSQKYINLSNHYNRKFYWSIWFPPTFTWISSLNKPLILPLFRSIMEKFGKSFFYNQTKTLHF